jgi:cytochrome c553
MPWPKGKPCPEYVKQKISATSTGKRTGAENPMFDKHGPEHPFYGRKHTAETKLKLSALRKEQYVGSNNPFYGKKHSEETKRKIAAYRLGKKHTEEEKKKISLGGKGLHAGELNHNWRGGLKKQKYPKEFDLILKRAIRARDGFLCQMPGCHVQEVGRAHNVHHIDYNKANNQPDNLITLCATCHAKTSNHREFWAQYFSRELGYGQRFH